MYQQMPSKVIAFLTTIRIKTTTPHKVPIKANTNPPAMAIVSPVLFRGEVPLVVPDDPAT
jgi:hypothetical protein